MAGSAAQQSFHDQTCVMTDVLDFAADVWRLQDKGTSTFISLPFDVKALFGRARCPVRVTVNDHTWRTTTQVYGEEYRLVVSAEARAAAGIGPGDRVHVLVRKDDAIGVVELPAELAARLRSDPEAREAFESLAASHRREYARWVAQAKLPATRVRRSQAATERLKSTTGRAESA